jgi:3-phenylpropionate/trans-cinnamate dioxygenase ferredoxin component
MSKSIKVAARGEIAPGDFRCVEVDGKKVVVYNVEGTFYATDNTCAHNGGPLGQGLFEGNLVTCPWHAFQFDVRTGEAVYDPNLRVATFPTRVEGDDVLIEV